ncbi:hypothetical protein JCM10207_003931 [Rhodosporidiobolus poonsookiae]
MGDYHPPNSPPPAHPSQLASSSSAPPPPHSLPGDSWTPGNSFYFGGSAAPPILNTRRAPPLKGRSSRRHTPQDSPSSTPPPSRIPASPPVLLTDGLCVCCDTPVRYPRASASFRCTVCETIVDLTAEQRRGKSRHEVPPTEATPVSEAQFLALVARFEQHELETDEQLARRLADVELGASTSTFSADDDDPEDLLVAYLVSAFNNLPSLEGSFRPPAITEAAEPPLPSLETLNKVYDLVKVRPAAMEVLRGMVEGILRRPGPTLEESDGAWLIALIECPAFLPDFTPDPEQRRWLLSHYIGLISNLPNTLHHALVRHLSSPSYPSALLLDKVELVCSFLSYRVGQAASENATVRYMDDWQVRAGARVASLLFNANLPHRPLPLSSFYVTLIDSLGEPALVGDFTRWETADRFALCQYPFLLSLGVKMGLLGWDGERQMIERAREAYRSSFATNQLESPLLLLRIRRDQLVSDSLRQISLNRENLKKTLRIAFEGEEGVDAGGLRKEWFLLLCRQLFDPQFGMFLHDPDSNLCWFNPASFETDDFWLVGAVVGLALYNLATLDIPLPSVTYKKLLSEPVTLSDLAQVQPALARGLQALLNYDGDVEETFCRTFVAEYEAWGETVEVELVERGREVPVTKANREEFVRLYTAFHLTDSVSAQFDAFAEGFREVCAGNALSLFKAEELELVVRGSTQPLEVDELRAVTVYEGFLPGDPTIELFWSVFATLPSPTQRALLAFITSSDRLPATGPAALAPPLKIQCLGPDGDRLPSSHTCFNSLGIYRYGSREKMERMLRRAVEESEGFGLR